MSIRNRIKQLNDIKSFTRKSVLSSFQYLTHCISVQPDGGLHFNMTMCTTKSTLAVIARPWQCAASWTVCCPDGVQGHSKVTSVA